MHRCAYERALLGTEVGSAGKLLEQDLPLFPRGPTGAELPGNLA